MSDHKKQLLAEWTAVPTAPEFEEEARIVNIFIPLVIGGLTEEQFNKYWAEAVAMATVKDRN